MNDNTFASLIHVRNQLFNPCVRELLRMTFGLIHQNARNSFASIVPKASRPTSEAIFSSNFGGSRFHAVGHCTKSPAAGASSLSCSMVESIIKVTSLPKAITIGSAPDRTMALLGWSITPRSKWRTADQQTKPRHLQSLLLRHLQSLLSGAF